MTLVTGGVSELLPDYGTCMYAGVDLGTGRKHPSRPSRPSRQAVRARPGASKTISEGSKMRTTPRHHTRQITVCTVAGVQCLRCTRVIAKMCSGRTAARRRCAPKTSTALPERKGWDFETTPRRRLEELNGVAQEFCDFTRFGGTGLCTEVGASARLWKV